MSDPTETRHTFVPGQQKEAERCWNCGELEDNHPRRCARPAIQPVTPPLCHVCEESMTMRFVCVGCAFIAGANAAITEAERAPTHGGDARAESVPNVTNICGGCNVTSLWEHRCHGANVCGCTECWPKVRETPAPADLPQAIAREWHKKWCINCQHGELCNEVSGMPELAVLIAEHFAPLVAERDALRASRLEKMKELDEAWERLDAEKSRAESAESELKSAKELLADCLNTFEEQGWNTAADSLEEKIRASSSGETGR